MAAQTCAVCYYDLEVKVYREEKSGKAEANCGLRGLTNYGRGFPNTSFEQRCGSGGRVSLRIWRSWSASS